MFFVSCYRNRLFWASVASERLPGAQTRYILLFFANTQNESSCQSARNHVALPHRSCVYQRQALSRNHGTLFLVLFSCSVDAVYWHSNKHPRNSMWSVLDIQCKYWNAGILWQCYRMRWHFDTRSQVTSATSAMLTQNIFEVCLPVASQDKHSHFCITHYEVWLVVSRVSPFCSK